ncbi:hypothetical protein LA76x_2506 [Lysobacter antibioticus]|uniref:Uncharacterized protein n=1 Tax=Lysobacter antibioticus TaxID=84531 RepID=A0A0S2FAT2_LYSAN|nr:hypothetical protein LA76x_2506 [Lysobacter antibioticus]
MRYEERIFGNGIRILAMRTSATSLDIDECPSTLPTDRFRCAVAGR